MKKYPHLVNNFRTQESLSSPFQEVINLCALILLERELIFFPAASTGFMFWMCVGNSADNSGIFLLVLGSAYTEPRPFLLCIPTPPVRRLWVHKELGGNTSRTADPN